METDTIYMILHNKFKYTLYKAKSYKCCIITYQLSAKINRNSKR